MKFYKSVAGREWDDICSQFDTWHAQMDNMLCEMHTATGQFDLVMHDDGAHIRPVAARVFNMHGKTAKPLCDGLRADTPEKYYQWWSPVSNETDTAAARLFRQLEYPDMARFLCLKAGLPCSRVLKKGLLEKKELRSKIIWVKDRNGSHLDKNFGLSGRVNGLSRTFLWKIAHMRGSSFLLPQKMRNWMLINANTLDSRRLLEKVRLIDEVEEADVLRMPNTCVLSVPVPEDAILVVPKWLKEINMTAEELILLATDIFKQ